VESGREGPTIPVQLRGGLQSPNRTVTLVQQSVQPGALCAYTMPVTPRQWLCLGPSAIVHHREGL
jgi:hypothetical protein